MMDRSAYAKTDLLPRMMESHVLVKWRNYVPINFDLIIEKKLITVRFILSSQNFLIYADMVQDLIFSSSTL